MKKTISLSALAIALTSSAHAQSETKTFSVTGKSSRTEACTYVKEQAQYWAKAQTNAVTSAINGRAWTGDSTDYSNCECETEKTSTGGTEYNCTVDANIRPKR